MEKTRKFFIVFILFFILILFKSTNVYADNANVSKNGFLETNVTGEFDYTKALEVLNLVNIERQKAGVENLTLDSSLTDSAMQRAAELSILFDHTRPSGQSCFTAINKSYGGAGENIALWQTTAQEVMYSWMNSSGHRANILSSGFKSIGIGCFYLNGSYHWVQVFTDAQGVGIVNPGRFTKTTAVEVPISNLKFYINNKNNYELELGKDTCLTCTADYNGKTYTLNQPNIQYIISDLSVASVSNGRIKALKLGTVTVTAKIGNNTANCTLSVVPKSFSVYYRTHVQNLGWQEYQKNGDTSGTSGQSLRLEGININLENLPESGNIEYSTHVQNIGWQGFVKNGQMSGTSGQALRLEAIKIRLTGDIANTYDIYYRVHCENFGWMGWAKNGESAGSAGYAFRLEAIEIKLVKKGNSAPGSTNNKFKQNIKYQTHVENIGWQPFVNSGEMSGTSGRSLRLEGIVINLDNSEVSGTIEYCTHVQNLGWQNYVKSGQMSGTSGQGLRLEAIKLRLTGDLANKYDVYYRVHCQNFGWMGLAKNGESAGSAGFAYRLEGIEIQLVDKGGPAPGSTAGSFIEK